MKSQQKSTKYSNLREKQLVFIESYIKEMGNISKACEEVGINRGTYYKWMKKPNFLKQYDEALEKHNDLIFQRILNLALKEDKDMLKFWAKTQMKHRGFVEKQELDITDQRTRIIIERANDDNNKVETKPKTGTSP